MQPDISLLSSQALKNRVRRFWDAQPCGLKNSAAIPGTFEFYDEIEEHRYREEGHIPLVAEFDGHAGQRVLEIGGGVGTDGRQFARHGARYVDADLSFNSLALARRGFAVCGLPGSFANGDAETPPFPADTFDLVYSHGVLHHTPDTEKAIGEVWRMLRSPDPASGKPGGKAIIMLYARESFTYVAAHVAGRLRLELTRARLGPEIFNQLVGLPPEHTGWLPEWAVINNSTDGVGNPLSKMYTASELRQLFSRFRAVTLEKHYFPRRKIPVVGPHLPLPLTLWLGRKIGFFWYVKAIK